jgi:hypothetical protein
MPESAVASGTRKFATSRNTGSKHTSLQEQFSRAQNHQSRILKLLAPLHTDIARNTMMKNFLCAEFPRGEILCEPEYPRTTDSQRPWPINLATPRLRIEGRHPFHVRRRPSSITTRLQPLSLHRDGQLCRCQKPRVTPHSFSLTFFCPFSMASIRIQALAGYTLMTSAVCQVCPMSLSLLSFL